MPELGEIKSGKDIGRRKGRYMWLECEICKERRWVYLRKDKTAKVCLSCAIKRRAGRGNYNWKGGTRKTTGGYIETKVFPNDFFHPMANKANYVREHRLVMAQHLGRCLQPWEIVHHKDKNRTNNRIENLKIVSDIGHNQITLIERKIDRLLNQNEKLLEQNKELKQEIRLLRWELRQRTSEIPEPSNHSVYEEAAKL